MPYGVLCLSRASLSRTTLFPHHPLAVQKRTVQPAFLVVTDKLWFWALAGNYSSHYVMSRLVQLQKQKRGNVID
jgi:hypothetical protein